MLPAPQKTFFPGKQIIGMLVIITAIYILAAIMQSNILFNCDVSWLMHVSDRLLNGGTYSKDFFEINPPLILFLYIPPALLAKYFSLPFIPLYLYVFSLGSVSLGICYFLAKKIFLTNDLATYLFTIALSTVYFILPLHEFGQREHLMLILIMPYLLAAACRFQARALTIQTPSSRGLSAGSSDFDSELDSALDTADKPRYDGIGAGNNMTLTTPLAVIIGLLAGLGLAIKPYFLLTPVLVELYGILYLRNFFAWRRPEIFSIFLVILIYIASILFFFQDYISLIIPIASHIYYAGLQESGYSLLLNPLANFCELTLLLYAAVYSFNPYKIFSTILAISLVSLLFSYFWQHTLWYYHLLPAASLAILLLTQAFTCLLQQKKPGKYYYLLLGGIGVIFLLFLLFSVSEIWTIIFVPALFFIFFSILFALILMTIYIDKNPWKIFFLLLIVIGSSFLFSRFLLETVWLDHRFLLTLLFLIIIYATLAPPPAKFNAVFLAILGTLIFAFPTIYFHSLYHAAELKKNNLSPIISFLQKNASHKSVYFFTTSTIFEFPAIDYAQAIPVSRVAYLGWIPGIIKQTDIQNHQQPLQQYQKYFFNMVNKDLETHKPNLIFIDVSDQKVHLEGIQFDHLAFFSQDQEFKTIWKSYKYMATIDESPYYKFQIYQRKIE